MVFDVKQSNPVVYFAFSSCIILAPKLMSVQIISTFDVGLVVNQIEIYLKYSKSYQNPVGREN